MTMDELSFVTLSEAAREGNLKVLKSCPRKEVNRRDSDGMTPVQWAASYGNIEALRILMGKGGNPDKPNNEGYTSLHLAAASGQLHCLVFLTNFGGNVYAVSDNGTTPIQEASGKDFFECVRHLEALITHQVEQDRYKVDKMQQKAKHDAERRIKAKAKLLQKLDRDYEQKLSKHRKIGASVTHYNGQQVNVHAQGYDNLYNKLTLSQLSELPRFERESFSDESPISNIDDDSNSTESSRHIDEFLKIRSLIADDLFERQNGSMGNDKLSDTTDRTELTSLSQNSRSTSKILASSLRSLHSSNSFTQNRIGVQGHLGPMVTLRNGQIVNITHTSKGILTNGQLLHSNTNRHGQNANVTITDMSVSKKEIRMAPLYTFLHALKLDEYRETFSKEKIDLRACLLCDENDLREIGLPLGPRKKITDAIKRRNTIFSDNDELHDSSV